MRTVSADFDGVIHAYRKGWHDGTIYDELMPGAAAALRLLMRDYAVFVLTARDPHEAADWIQARTAIPCVVQVDPDMEFWGVQGELLVTNRKLPAIAYIDDLGIRFESWEQALADLQRHTPARKPTGLDRVAEAVRRSRGGDAPPQIRGFA